MEKERNSVPEKNLADVIQCCTQIEKNVICAYYNLYRGVLGRLQVEALDKICHRNGIIAKDLAAELDIPKQYASKITLKLRDMGFVTITACENDKRAQWLLPTQEGMAFLQSHVEQSNEEFLRRIEALSPEDRGTLFSAFSDLQRILNLLEQESS